MVVKAGEMAQWVKPITRTGVQILRAHVKASVPTGRSSEASKHWKIRDPVSNKVDGENCSSRSYSDL